ncbi:Guanine nucleotide-exchange factor SEC12 [Hypsizygus marmoreus]|uniref:Guanine nucleotide-exchange factor SEC12 n=1 Tax=Hypsizygus marmoreus TaxID=39966 RepID=A0A369JKB4_HYPMA|nr:Guanine nucleotide-exchange factor SEC12 [Hypsizygus marmoreus]
MRTRHTPHALPAFPVYSSSFLSESELVLGGGGGASRSGIKNKLRLYNVGNERALELLDEFELEKGEDAPMSMAVHSNTSTIVCGVNSTIEKLEKDENENCRVFTAKDHKLGLLSAQGTLPPGDLDDYQKVTVLSPDGTLLAVAGAHDLSLLSYPSMTPVAEPVHTDKEIYDASFSGTTLVIATTLNLLVYALPLTKAPQSPSPTKAKGKGKAKKKKSPSQATLSLSRLDLLKTVELPNSIGGSTGATFRSARYHPTEDKVFYTAINTSPPRTRKSKATQRVAYICKWNAESWTVEKTRKASDKGLTCFDISKDGRFLGFGSSDLTIGLLDANTLAPLVTILKAHEFPPTTITFNPTSSLLVSGSADNSVRIVSVPQTTAGGSSWSILLLLLITLLVVFLALAAQKYINNGSLHW